MKKTQIVLLILIAASIAVLISFLKGSPTYDTVAIAKSKPGKSVSLIAKLDRTQPVEYDYKNPNFLSFTVIDSLGSSVKVVYHSPKPDNLEHSERLVLKGAIKDDHFECKEILMKCPSKYKEDVKIAEKSLPTSMTSPADKNVDSKY
jgi:cytochrome c-type biogenesis protein CcmE